MGAVIDLKVLALAFGIGAGLAWFASAACSYCALKIKLDITAPDEYAQDQIGISMGTDDSGEGVFTINGMRPPTQRAFADYKQKVSFRNTLSSIFNAIGALMACAAAYFAYII